MIITDYTDSYLENYTSYKNYWNYEDGCILSGCAKLFEASGKEKYRNFVLDYLDAVITDTGVIINFDNSKHSLDSFNSGKALLFAYRTTEKEKYRKAADFLYSKISSYPRTNEGSFIHKSIYPDQVWLDGLYMLLPFYAESIRMNGSADFSDIFTQYKNARKNMFCDKSKLYFHGYDSAGVQPWADKNTGCSPSFWLRSIGWFLMSLTDTFEAIGNPDDSCSRLVSELFCEAAEGIVQYADSEAGLFHQVTDKPEASGNYTETSGSLMISYTLMKSVRLGIPVFSGAFETGRNIFNSVISEKLIKDENGYKLTDICCSAGLGPGNERNGSTEYYISEKTVSDDPKGTGALMMAMSEILRAEKGTQS